MPSAGMACQTIKISQYTKQVHILFIIKSVLNGRFHNF